MFVQVHWKWVRWCWCKWQFNKGLFKMLRIGLIATAKAMLLNDLMKFPMWERRRRWRWNVENLGARTARRKTAVAQIHLKTWRQMNDNNILFVTFSMMKYFCFAICYRQFSASLKQLWCIQIFNIVRDE